MDLEGTHVQMASSCISMTNLVVSDWHMEASLYVLLPLTLNQIRLHFKVYLDVTVVV